MRLGLGVGLGEGEGLRLGLGLGLRFGKPVSTAGEKGARTRRPKPRQSAERARQYTTGAP